MHVQVDGFLLSLHVEVGVVLGGADTAEAREHRSESNLAPRGPVPDAELPLDDVDLEVRHLVRHGLSAQPLLGMPTVDRRCSAVHRGYPTMVDLSVGMRVIRNRIVTQGAETAI